MAAAEGNSLSANVRLFAQLNVALADVGIACWDAKYFYDLWRPETAIQNAEFDNNSATSEDDAWRPLLITPAHPEYVSGHSTFSNAAASILAANFGDNTAFSTTSVTLPGVTRNYTSFSQAADEAGRSRIYGGIHYEFTNQAGNLLGAQVANAVLARFTQTQDQQAPVAMLQNTPDNVKTNLTLTGQLLDNLSGVASAQYRIDSGALKTLPLGANGNFSITTTFALDGSADGNHSVTIIGRDIAGNLSAGYTRSFVLDTRAPVINLNSIAQGDTLTGNSRLTGSANATGTTLTQLTYQLDNGANRSLIFDGSTGVFDAALNFGSLTVGDHILTITAQDAAGNQTELTRTVKVDALAPFNITNITPVAGSNDVGVTQRPQINFSRAVNAATLTSESLYATGPDGGKLPATIVPSLDGGFAWLFFTNPMPGGSQITLHVDGSKIRAAADGGFLDADGNGSMGGVHSISFTTVSTTPIVGTKLIGKIVDPGPDLQPMTFDDIGRGVDGIIHTADDVFKLPIVHAKVYILGLEDKFVYTDAQGNFELTNVPAGEVKLAVDDRTATNAPNGVFWPEMVMAAELKAGVTNTMMGSMGTTSERQANADRLEVYLPRIASSVMQSVSDTQPTVITATDPKAAPTLSEEQRNKLTLTINPGSAVDEQGNVIDNVQIGIATVPPELVRDMLPPGVLQHTFDITIQAPGVANFIEPVQITFPNMFNAAPGTKLNILSFDHTTGMLVINGTGTVSADGLTVVSDPDSGVRAPGWHGMAPPGPTGRGDTPRPPNPGPGPGGPGPGPGTGTGPIFTPPPVIWIPIVTQPPVGTNPPTGTTPPGTTTPPVVVVPGLPNSPRFDINVQLPATGLSPTVQQAINDVARHWEQIVVGDLPADWTIDGLVDDLRIRVNVASIDGAGKQLASSQILDTRTGSIKLPSLASITLDSADLATLSPDRLQAVLMHEFAHALGFGELWASLGLVDNSTPGNPSFKGVNAVAQYAALKGSAQTSVPLDNRSGANATHWRETIFGNELMTPLLDVSGPYPLSALSIAVLKDMGYVVNFGAADAFTHPGAGFVFHPNATAPANSGNGELLDATGGGVSITDVQNAAAPTAGDHLFFAFDFGATTSPVAGGFAAVSSSTTYAASRGWGWQAGSSVSDRLTGTNPLTPLTADFAQTNNATFLVDLPNGTYDVIITLGDDAGAHEGTQYYIEDARRGAVSTLTGEHASLTHRVEVIDGQMNLKFTSTGAPVALNALEIHQVSSYVTPASNTDFTSGTFFLAIQNLDTGFVLRDQVDVTTGAPLCINGVVLSPNTAYRQYVYHLETNTVGVSEFVTPSSGVNFDMPEILMGNRISADSDQDGLEDAAEFIIGTRANSGDTDNDGIKDRDELLQGLDPLGGLGIPTGIVAAVPLQGSAEAVAVSGATDGAGKTTTFIATGNYGLAVVDTSQFSRPKLLVELNLSGVNTDVAVDPNRNIAVLAANDAGLHIVDVSDPSKPLLQQTVAFASPVSRVEVRDGIAYLANGSDIATVDLNTGEIRSTLSLSALNGGTLTDLAIDGNTLFTMDNSRNLRAISIVGDVLTVRDSLTLTTAGGKLFVGGGVAYVGGTEGFQQGFSTVDVSNIADLKLLSNPDVTTIANGAIVSNGSGLAVSIGNLAGIGNMLHVSDVTDPTNTSRFVTQYALPAAPKDLALANGLAFVADGGSGLQIVNYVGFDTQGVAPTVSVSVDGVDADPATAGTQVLEGRTVRVIPVITDDVQVRNVELLVNGQIVSNDIAFPFELFTQVPTIADGGNTLNIQIRATDTGGNVTLSAPVTLTVVPDTFAPVVSSVSIAEGDRRFFVRSIDMVFDEPIDTALLSTSGISLLRSGNDGLFGTADDITVPVTLNSRAFGQRISVVIENLLPPGEYRFTLSPTIIKDTAGNSLAAPVVRNFSIRPASDVKPVSGVPAIPTAPSANPGQQIGITVPFNPTTARAEFKVIDASGTVTTTTVSAIRSDIPGSIAYFTAPLNAVTGDAVVYSLVGSVRTDFADGTFPLQILPTITDIQVESVAGDGSTAQVLIAGTGFVEGGNSEYRFGSSLVLDAGTGTGADVFGRNDAVLGNVPNGYVRITVPLSDGVFGGISLKTTGGVSAQYTASLASIDAVALSGVPADAALASANAGQSVTLKGAGLSLTSDILMRWTDVNGNLQMDKLSPSAVSADGASATLIVPPYANGVFSLQLFGSASQPKLQIVPTLSSIDVQDRTVIFGSGFVEGATVYQFPGASVSDTTADPNNLDVYYTPSTSVQNGSAYLNRTALPTHGLGNATVTTAGGTSAVYAINSVRTDVTGTSLGDVAVDATGKLWVGDYSNPGHLLKLDPATGQVLQTIELTNSYGTPYAYNYLGLQVLTAGMTLGSTAVPAGSLLVFNGYANTDRVVAVNPANGAVIASLALDQNYDLTGATYDAASNRIFLTANNVPAGGASIVAINAATGAQTGVTTAPYNIQSWAGLAIQPSNGHLWLGAVNGGSTLVEYLIGAGGALTQLRTLDVSAQGVNQNEISGLSFDAAGKLWVASTQGEIYKVTLS